MFPVNLIRHRDPELFFAVVAPIGADLERACLELSNALKTFKYKLETIRVIELLQQFGGYLSDEPTAEDEKIEGRMNAGDTFRASTGRNDALALLALSAVVRHRGKTKNPIPRQAYLFRSLKRPEEVNALRRVYGSNLIVLGIHSGRHVRVDNLAERIAQSYFAAQRDQYRDKAETLVLRDESDERKQHGQRLRSAFAMADFFLDSSEPLRLRANIERFLNLLFGKPIVTPTPDELAMAHASVAAMRSAELGRQVGAAVADDDGNVIAMGTNEVPKAQGGFYWDGCSNDGRDWSRGFDSSDHFKQASFGELLQVLSSEGMLSKKLTGLSTAEQIEKLSPFIKQTRYMQLIEFVRATHAEMGALLDAASRGVPVRGCSMYVTTFPCHECARNIIAAGIKRVVYIEPYAKSLAIELHDDALQLDANADVTKIPFVPFLGVAPRHYSDMFVMDRRKGEDGKIISWDAVEANPRVSGSFWSYLQYEKEDLKLLNDTLKKKGLVA